MPRNTLFELPNCFTKRIDTLKDQGVTEPELLLQVELGFALMERLGLDDEPITAVWVILSGMFIRHPKLQNLSIEERRAIANVRQIVPFSARFNWLNALRDYIKNTSKGSRNYDFDIQDLDNIIINAAKNLKQAANQDIYERCLTDTLIYRQRERRNVKSATYYQFESQTSAEKVRLQVKFTKEQVTTPYPLPWFDGVKERSYININLNDLEGEAVFLDNRENWLAQKYSWSNTSKGNWSNRFHKLNYHTGASGG